MRIVVFSSSGPNEIHRLLTRIQREVPEARVCGVLYEQRSRKSFATRGSTFIRNLWDPDFWPYAATRVSRLVGNRLSAAGAVVLQLVHAARCGKPEQQTLERVCETFECDLQITNNFHSEESLQFVRDLRTDLGIVYATRILKPSLFAIPRLGSINIHKRKVPEYRGGGPVGLWELLDEQPEIGITVHQVTEKVDAGAVVNSATISIEPYDNLASLALKAHVVGNDLLVQSVTDFARGTVTLRPQPQGAGRTFRNPSPQLLARYERELRSRRPVYRPHRGRSTAKLVLRTIAKLPLVAVRNWTWQRRRSFPVVILFHHLVADRPHRMAISTEYFLKHVQFLRRFYRIVSLNEAIESLKANDIKEPTVVLTFDDGYRDNFINLRAVVEKTGVPVTMFISTDHITKGLPFQHDVRRGIEGFAPLNWKQVAQMQAAGFEIGSHTRTHFDCGCRDLPDLQREIVGSRRDLESSLQGRVAVFSFPFGLPENISREAIGVAAESYPYFCSAFGGYNFGTQNGAVKHMKRWAHPNSLWLLELQIQDALEPERRAPLFDDLLKGNGNDQRSGHHLLQQRLGQRSFEQEAHHAKACEGQPRVVGQFDR